MSYTVVATQGGARYMLVADEDIEVVDGQREFLDGAYGYVVDTDEKTLSEGLPVPSIIARAPGSWIGKVPYEGSRMLAVDWDNFDDDLKPIRGEDRIYILEEEEDDSES